MQRVVGLFNNLFFVPSLDLKATYTFIHPHPAPRIVTTTYSSRCGNDNPEKRNAHVVSANVSLTFTKLITPDVCSTFPTSFHIGSYCRSRRSYARALALIEKRS